MEDEHIAKKRRTQRACGACRRRKIRCDGKAPCSACTFNDLACSYDDDNRRRNGPEYIQSLEKKIDELEALLGHSLSPTSRQSGSRRASRAQTGASDSQRAGSGLQGSSGHGSSDDDALETIVAANDKTGNKGHDPERYFGEFSGLGLLQRMRALCVNVAGLHLEEGVEAAEDDFIHSFDCHPPSESMAGSWEAFALLPSKERLLTCVGIAIDEGCCLLNFVDRSAIDTIIKRIYDTDDMDYTSEDRKSLAFLYALLALGRRFEITKGDADPSRAEHGLAKGLRYFRASRSMLDVADCHDLISLQTVLCMVIYLQASSMLSTCYSYICAGVAAALRMGLHVPSASDGLPEHERNVRRCLYSVLNIMDTYVTTALGLPKTLRDVQKDHSLPMIDHETPEASARLVFDHPNAPLAATHAHAKLISILERVVQYIYPVIGPIAQKNGHYSVSYSSVATIEKELDSWLNALPDNTALDGDDNLQSLRSQLLLRLAYAHVQMVLYRPFLHHAVKHLRPTKGIQYKAYACSSACVKAAMQVVWLAEALEARGLFNEANWFVAPIVSFAATMLMLFVLSNEDDATVNETADAAERVKNILARHAGRSPSTRRCYTFLQELSDARAKNKRNSVSEAQNFVSQAFDLSSVSSFGGGHSGYESQPPIEAHTIGEMSDEEEQMLQAMSYPRLHPYLDEFGHML